VSHGVATLLGQHHQTIGYGDGLTHACINGLTHTCIIV